MPSQSSATVAPSPNGANDQTPPMAPTTNGQQGGPALPTPDPKLPSGYVSLKDVSARERKNDPYTILRTMVGGRIAFKSANIDLTAKSGTAVVVRFDPNEGEQGDEFEITIPKASLKALAAAMQRAGENVLVAKIEETKRGVALR